MCYNRSMKKPKAFLTTMERDDISILIPMADDQIYDTTKEIPLALFMRWKKAQDEFFKVQELLEKYSEYKV